MVQWVVGLILHWHQKYVYGSLRSSLYLVLALGEPMISLHYFVLLLFFFLNTESGLLCIHPYYRNCFVKSK